MLRIKNDDIQLVPETLLKYQLFKNLDTLYKQFPNTDLIHNIKSTEPKTLEIAIETFLSIVNYNRSSVENKYITKRIIGLKSAERVLWELEKYTNMEYDKSPDPESPGDLNTRYAPRLLKVVIEKIETDKPETINEVLESLFAAILYYKELDYYIKNLIIRLNVDLVLESNDYIINAFNLTEIIDIDE